MRKFLFLIVISFSASSQVTELNAGFRLGLTSSQISGDDLYGFGQFGLSGAVFTSYQFTDNWSSSFAIEWNPKGARNYISSSNINVYRLRANYVDIPLMVNYHFHRFQIHGGVGVNFYINHKETFNSSLVPVQRAFNPLDLTINLGLSYELTDHFLVSFIYSNSVIPVRDHLNPSAYPDPPLVFGNFHRSILNKGQYFTYLGLKISYFFKSI